MKQFLSTRRGDPPTVVASRAGVEVAQVRGALGLLELAGLKNPFVDGTVEEVVAGLKPYLKRKVKYTIRPVKEEDLKKVAEVVSRCGSNVVSVQHDGSDPNMPISSCFLKLTLETRDAAQIEQIRTELTKAGFQLVTERV